MAGFAVFTRPNSVIQRNPIIKRITGITELCGREPSIDEFNNCSVPLTFIRDASMERCDILQTFMLRIERWLLGDSQATPGHSPSY